MKVKQKVNVLKRYAWLIKNMIILAFLVLFYIVLYKLYIPQTNTFGCFDECMNIGGGYFMTQNKELFSQIWFNHQPFMGYISYLIQLATTPINLYELLLRHMQFMLLFSLVANFFIIKRFGWAGVGFVIIYELSKYYIFGYRFLGESYVAYALVYMSGLIWYKFQEKTIPIYEYFIAAFLTWFVIFTREPFSITALLAFAILLGKPKELYKKISFIIFAAISAITVLLQPIEEYLYSLFVVSTQGSLHNELQNNLLGAGLLKIFFYPFYVLVDAFGKEINEFWWLLIGVSIAFAILSMYMVFVRKKYLLIACIYILLGFANLRYLPFGDTYYGAFHIIPWYSMALIFLFLMIRDNFQKFKKFTIPSLAIIAVFFIVYLAHPNTFFKHPSDLQRDLLVNYGEVLQIGTIVNTISESEQTFFVDKAGANDTMALAYYEAKRPSAYKYSWYIYFAPGHERYVSARADMLQNYPPDFYYTGLIDSKLKNHYVQLHIDNKPSKLYVKKAVYERIPAEKIQKAQVNTSSLQ